MKEGGVQSQSTTSQPQAVLTQLSRDSIPFTQNPNSAQINVNKKKAVIKKSMNPDFRTTEDPLSTASDLKLKATVPVQPEVVDLSSDDDESDDEIHHFMVSLRNLMRSNFKEVVIGYTPARSHYLSFID